jgi:hypothetical protein
VIFQDHPNRAFARAGSQVRRTIDECEYSIGFEPDSLLENSLPTIRRLKLPRDVTARVVRRARDERTSVHNALCTAFLIADRSVLPKWRDEPVRFVPPPGPFHLTGLWGPLSRSGYPREHTICVTTIDGHARLSLLSPAELQSSAEPLPSTFLADAAELLAGACEA